MSMSQTIQGRTLRQRTDDGNVVRSVTRSLRALFAALNGTAGIDVEQEYRRQLTDRAVERDRIRHMTRHYQ